MRQKANCQSGRKLAVLTQHFWSLIIIKEFFKKSGNKIFKMICSNKIETVKKNMTPQLLSSETPKGRDTKGICPRDRLTHWKTGGMIYFSVNSKRCDATKEAKNFFLNETQSCNRKPSCLIWKFEFAYFDQKLARLPKRPKNMYPQKPLNAGLDI